MPVTVDPETFDLTVEEDRAWAFEWTVTDEDGVVINLTGTTAANFTVKDDLDAAAALFTKTLGAGITLTDPTNGKLQVAGNPADTDGSPGRKVYELDITLGTHDSLRKGRFIVERKIGA